MGGRAFLDIQVYEVGRPPKKKRTETPGSPVFQKNMPRFDYINCTHIGLKKDHKNKNCTTIRTKTIFPHASARGRGKTQKKHRKNNKKPDSLERGVPAKTLWILFFLCFFLYFCFFVCFDVFLVFASPPCRGWGKIVFVPLVRCGSAVFN